MFCNIFQLVVSKNILIKNLIPLFEVENIRVIFFIKLTSDISHWCCVAENLLENQTGNMNLAIKQTYHIYARTGFAQNPQVIQLRSDTYTDELTQFKQWWMMIDYVKKENHLLMTIVPEYGSTLYAQLDTKTKELLANQ